MEHKPSDTVNGCDAEEVTLGMWAFQYFNTESPPSQGPPITSGGLGGCPTKRRFEHGDLCRSGRVACWVESGWSFRRDFDIRVQKTLVHNDPWCWKSKVFRLRTMEHTAGSEEAHIINCVENCVSIYLLIRYQAGKPTTMDQQQCWIPGKSLGDLPEELMEMIIKLLPMRELAYISRTCRDFRRQAEPHLYTDVKHTFALFRTINYRPELAKHVKAYSFDVGYMSKFWAQTQDDKALRRAAIIEVNRIFQVPETVGQRCDAEYEICWLLSRFNNLQTVRVGRIASMGYTPLMLATRWIGWDGFKGVCPDLKNVEMIMDFFFRLRYADYGYLQLLPGLDSLVYTREPKAGPYFYSHVMLDATMKSSLTKLAIEWVPVSEPDVEALVLSSPHLTEFRLYSLVASDRRLHGTNFSLLQRALLRAKRLARVDIRLRWWPPHVSAEAIQQVTYGAFRGFAELSHLEELRIPICALMGWEVPERVHEVRGDELLPSSLRTLTLTQGLGEVSGYQWTPWPTAALCWGLLSGASKRLPRLQRLAIQRVPRQEWQVWLQPGSPIGQAAAAEGVEWDASRVGTD